MTAVMLAACGTQSPALGPPCGVRVELSGAVEASLPADLGDPIVCANLFGRTGGARPGIGAHVVLRALDAYLDLAVDDVGPGETGEQFPARLRVGTAQPRTYTARDCTADIVEHELIASGDAGETSILVGTGRCSGPATADGDGDDAITIGPFDFVLEVTWDR